jgi:hypothetical protein
LWPRPERASTVSSLFPPRGRSVGSTVPCQLSLACVALLFLHRLGMCATLGPVWMPEQQLWISPSSNGVVFGHLGDRVVGPVWTRSWDRCVCCRGLEAAATTQESVILVLSVVSDCLGSRVVDSSGVRPWGWCVAFGALVLASVSGLGTGVDVRATALELSALSVLPSCSGRSHIGWFSARPQGRCVAFGCTVIASIPYKLVVWVSGMSLH